jgi:hypothetical protein
LEQIPKTGRPAGEETALIETILNLGVTGTPDHRATEPTRHVGGARLELWMEHHDSA